MYMHVIVHVIIIIVFMIHFIMNALFEKVVSYSINTYIIYIAVTFCICCWKCEGLETQITVIKCVSHLP